MNNFDEVVKGIREDSADPVAVEQAASRIRKQLFGPGAPAAGKLRSCADFQSLIPAYLQKSLPDARRMLLEDHAHECVVCRKAIEDARGDGHTGVKVIATAPRTGRSNLRKWAIAAGLTIAAGLAWMSLSMSPGGVVATIESINGAVYAADSAGSLPVGMGRQLIDGERVQTAKGSVAVVRLFDGSLVEMNERAFLSVRRGWRGTTISLERGNIIVEAARQKSGRLYVASGDCQVSVKGTIFSVNRGTRGSRVSVVEGEVEVSHGGRSQSLKPGGQATTEATLMSVPVADEIAWSRNVSRYLAILGELNALQRKLEQLPAQGLRYSSRLLNLVPSDAVLYAAIPNAGNALPEAKRLFEDTLKNSPELSKWWGALDRNGIEAWFERLQRLSSNLGDEVAFATAKPGLEVVMAEVRGTGLQQVLDQILREERGAPPFVYSIQRDILLVAKTADRLRQAELLVAVGGSPMNPFKQRIAQAYRSGAGWLLAANMEQILTDSVQNHMKGPAPIQSVLNKAGYLVVERREIAGRVENRAVLSFSGRRREGIAGWLASPGPMGTLEFVTPEAGMAVSVIAKNPRSIVEEMFSIARQSNPSFDQHLAEMEQRLGLKLIDDLAAPLGSEATLAIDGALIPVPSWKLAVEVYSPQRLQHSLEQLVQAFNRNAEANAVKLTLTKEDANGRTFYRLSRGGVPGEVHYTFVDNYFLAAVNRSTLTQAIQARQTGRTLARSEKFRSELPAGSNPNCSAVFYHNIGGVLGPLANQLNNSNIITAEQRQAVQVLSDSRPGVVCAYGEPDQITAASYGSFLGLNLGMMATLDQVGPLLRREARTATQ